MFELKSPEELAPRLELPENARILSINGPNLVEGLKKSDFRSQLELGTLEDESYDTVFTWFLDSDAKKAGLLVENSARILAPGGSMWIIVPKKHSVEHGQAKGLDKKIVAPKAKSLGFIEKKSLGIGPHFTAVRMVKHG